MPVGTAAALRLGVRRTRERGFTLIELMIVVAVVAILAAIAINVFLGSTRKTHSLSEVTAMFAELSRAEAQYAVEHNSYFSTGTDSSDIFPASPTASAQAVGTLPTAWTTVGVTVQSQNLYCGYVAVAGTSSDAYPDFAASFSTITPQGNWYALYAECNADGDSTVNGQFFEYSGDLTIQKLNETK